MKIFAKRKRTVEKEHSTVKENDLNKTFESDEIVKELLKQDPSTWNAKQRRLIKRYNERNPNEVSVPPLSSIKEPSNLQKSLVSSRTDEIEGGKEEEEDDDHCEESDASDDDAHENGDDDEEEDHDEEDEEVGENSNQEETNVTTDDKTYPPEGDVISSVDSAAKESDTTLHVDPTNNRIHEQPKSESNSSIDDALKDILDKLNSKQRRTLMRQYDRDQNVEHLRNEAVRLLQENEQAAAKESQNTAVAACDEVTEPVTKKRRRRGPVVDESKLSPEERMRREEQRRIQALARASNHNTANIVTDDTDAASIVRTAGTTGTVQPKHRHPLNSERRRANRRKPKWEVTSQKKKFPPNEHDTSGYHMRKVTKGPSLPE